VDENLSLNVQALNLLDEDYESAYGYGNKGLTLHGGVSYRF
jgi:outer membrane cobalamin receptor